MFHTGFPTNLGSSGRKPQEPSDYQATRPPSTLSFIQEEVWFCPDDSFIAFFDGFRRMFVAFNLVTVCGGAGIWHSPRACMSYFFLPPLSKHLPSDVGSYCCPASSSFVYIRTLASTWLWISSENDFMESLCGYHKAAPNHQGGRSVLCSCPNVAPDVLC